MCGDDGAAAEMIGGADVIQMLVAENQHVDLVGRTTKMMEAFQQGRKIRRQPDIDQDGSGAAAQQIGIRGAVLKPNLVDVLGCLYQGAGVIVQENRKRTRFAFAHEFTVIRKVAALDALKRLLNASMIISANAGCWLTRYTKIA